MLEKALVLEWMSENDDNGIEFICSDETAN